MRLDGKVAVITGGGSGFGQSAAVLFAREGAHVLIVDRNEAGCVETTELGRRSDLRIDYVVADVSSADDVAAVFTQVAEKSGRIDVLVNNAGVVASARDTWDSTEDVWDRILRINLKSVYLCTRAAVPHMINGGGGSVVNTASIAASCQIGGLAYAASKGGMIAYTRHSAGELADRNVRVNCVSPGFMRSPMTTGEREGLSAEEQDVRLHEMGQLVPMMRIGSMLDIANAMLFLASDDSGYVTGQEIVVDGGYLVR